MFESDQQLFELIFCAHSGVEEEQWKNEIQGNTSTEKVYQLSWLSTTSCEYSVLYLDIKTMGPVIGQPGTLMRQQSIRRAATLNSRKNGRQVIIKNTSSTKDRGESALATLDSVGRSQSLLSTNKVLILAPKRAERQQMGQLMASVWTRDKIPYPSMLGDHKGSFISSATTVMRKLSRASTTTTSTANSVVRSISYSSIMEDDPSSPPSVGACVPQTDGTCSPTPQKHLPVTSQPEVEGQDQEVAPSQKVRSSFGAKLRKTSNGSKRHQSREVSGASTVLAAPESIGIEHGKGRLRKPKTLLKAFSTEGIRGFFH